LERGERHDVVDVPFADVLPRHAGQKLALHMRHQLGSSISEEVYGLSAGLGPAKHVEQLHGQTPLHPELCAAALALPVFAARLASFLFVPLRPIARIRCVPFWIPLPSLANCGSGSAAPVSGSVRRSNARLACRAAPSWTVHLPVKLVEVKQRFAARATPHSNFEHSGERFGHVDLLRSTCASTSSSQRAKRRPVRRA